MGSDLCSVELVQCPLLCKEFIIDAWQIYKARVSGADAVLLIAAVLPDQDLTYMTKIAKALGMAALIEVGDYVVNGVSLFQRTLFLLFFLWALPNPKLHVLDISVSLLHFCYPSHFLILQEEESQSYK